MRTAPILFKAIRRMAGVAALATLVPTLAWAADAPVPTPDKGDMAWMLTSTALVLLMSVPALGLFYGGLVRTKNMLSVLMQVFVGFSLITVLWCIYGYSLAFTAGNEFIGGFSRLFLAGTFNAASGAFSTIGTFDKGVVLNELVYVGFQATFAAITCCLILGSLVERVKFSAILLFLAFWFTFCYCPVAHMVWYVPGLDTNPADHPVGGLLANWGALDFAGGTVVHINSGVAGLVGATVLGKRIGLGKEPMPPHSLTMTMIGASLLWFGWFGFNAGSALEANGSAALAFMNTYLATACAVLAWMGTEWLIKGKPSWMSSACTLSEASSAR
jgi:ammonium transporter, Amt family